MNNNNMNNINTQDKDNRLCECGHIVDEHSVCGCESWLIFDEAGKIIGTKVDGEIHHDCFSYEPGPESDDKMCSCNQLRLVDDLSSLDALTQKGIDDANAGNVHSLQEAFNKLQERSEL